MSQSTRVNEILIVEDSSTQAEQLKYFLEKGGFDVSVAKNGMEALSMLSKMRPIMIISDILMPEMDGYQLCRHVKSDESLKDIPFIMLTSLSKPDDIIRGLESGTDNLLNKPYDEEYLISMIQNILINKKIRATSKMEVGIDIYFAGKKYFLTSERIQIIDLLISTYEIALRKGRELELAHREFEEACVKLGHYKEHLEDMVRERTRELESAQSELKKLFNAIEQTSEAIVITDVDGAIQYVNPAFSVMTSYSAEDVMGRNPRILNSGMNPPELFTDMWKTILSGNKWVGTLINKKKTGELYHEEIMVNPVINNEGKITNFIAIENDISDRIEAEENLKKKNIELEAAKDIAEAAYRAKSEFLANMSHELRTPLNAIIGFSDLLKSDMVGPITEEQRGFAGDIYESGQHLLRLISDILDLSRIEAGKEELEITEFPLEALIKESLMMFHEKSIKHNIKLTTDVAGDIGNIKADARKIKQVVLNLMSNAIKFTPDGGEVGIKASKTEDEVIVMVWDTGIGIKEEDMQRLFMPFVQLEKHLTKKHAGTGLGLMLSKKFVEMHEGKIWAESEFGKGSRFTFVIAL